MIGLIANVWVASSNLKTLGDESVHAIDEGLGRVSEEYLVNYIGDASARINVIFRQAMADTKMLADITQIVVDHGDELRPLFELVPRLDPLSHEMVYNKEGGWLESAATEPSVISLYGTMLLPDGSIPQETQDGIRRSALLDLVMPAVRTNGAEKLQLYYVAPDEASFLRVSPHASVAAYFDQTDHTPDKRHKTTPFWVHYFPGLVHTWKKWLTDDRAKLEEYGKPEVKSEMRQITVTSPYVDAAGGGMVMTFFHPIWTRDRQRFNGAIGVDLQNNRIEDIIQTVALGETGFAFLAQSNGDLLAIKEDRATALKLKTDDKATSAKHGLIMYGLSLRKSEDPTVVGLELPTDDEVHFEEKTFAGTRYLLVMKRMGEFNQWAQSADPPVQPESWTLAFLVPTKEIYSALDTSQAAVARSTKDVQSSQLIVMVFTLLVVLAGVFLISRRMTTDLVALSNAASRLMRKDYDVRVDIKTEDEIGHLGVAFNEMASEIQEYTHNLEALVAQRTAELQNANEEIKALNEQLAEENLRLAAEIDVARRLQSMVLPQADELEQIEGLDIDGYMKPADEVGGDYYDVLQSPSGVTFGVGDVTGHGLESGVLMLMVQTAIRTLQASGEKDPARFLDLVNRTVYLNKQRMDVDRNLSLCLLDYRNGRFTLTGQHEDVILVRADGAVELLDTTRLGFPIGLDLDILNLFASSEIEIECGDVVVLYTDGVTEAENDAGKYYGIERLCQVAAEAHTRRAKEIREAIVDDVTRFIGTHKVFDDITLLIIKKT